jgi:YidC/Oxa1 family membrane protein insertase
MAILSAVFYQPLYNLAQFIYGVVPIRDFGITVILITIIVKLVLYPFSRQSIKAQRSMLELQPKINTVREKFKDDKQAQAKALMDLYKEHKVNPFSSCLPLLVQLPFLIALYRVFINTLKNTGSSDLYPFIHNPGVVSGLSFGVIDLGQPSYVLAIIAGLAQYFQARQLQVQKPVVATDGSKDESVMAAMNKQMLYMMPILTAFIGSRLPAGLALYWIVTTLLTYAQQWQMLRRVKIDKLAQ